MTTFSTPCPECKRTFSVDRETYRAMDSGDAEALARTCGRPDCSELARALADAAEAAKAKPARRQKKFPPELREMVVPEKAILSACLQYLAIRGVFAWRQNQGAMEQQNPNYRPGYGRKPTRKIRFAHVDGISDIIGTYKGRFLAIETKRVGNKPTEDQRGFLERVDKEGGIAIVAYSVDDVKNALDEVDKGLR